MRPGFRPAAILLAAAALFLSCSHTPAPVPAEQDLGVPRIVLLADPHLPYKSTLWNSLIGNLLYRDKESVRTEVNGWRDIARIVVLGDITGTRGTEAEYAAAKGYLAGFSAPLRLITGNHDFIYADERNSLVGLSLGSAVSRTQKLGQFAAAFGLESLQAEESLAGYRLIYLSSDSTERKYQVGLSDGSLRWLDETLARSPGSPTIVFYHAPLAGTLLNDGKPARGDSVAQPAAALDAVLRRHPQVFLWVSGHTHTAPWENDFASGQNLYDGRIMNIHCTDMDRPRIYTNSLWLYPDRVLVRTYDHYARRFLKDKDRTIAIPRI